MNNYKSPSLINIEGVTGVAEICELYRKHYRELLNIVSEVKRVTLIVFLFMMT